MKAVALICEFNPFHKGHAYLIEKIKESFPEKPLVCFMSGEFVQRGEVAYLPKEDRAKMAVTCGANAVFALPCAFSLAPAREYANCAVKLIEATGLCDTLCFGSESGELAPLLEAVRNMSGRDFELALSKKLDSGLPYPVARSAAYAELFSDSTLIETPNNALGIEYLSHVKKLTPITFKRLEGEGVCSASHLRSIPVSKAKDFMPEEAYQLLLEADEQGRIYCESLGERTLLTLIAKAEGEFADVPADMAVRIKKTASESATLCEFFRGLSVKQYTDARLRRMAMCTALSVKREEWDELPPYAQLLGADQRGAALLSENRRGDGLPILTKPSRASEISSAAKDYFDKNAERERIASAFRQSFRPLSASFRQSPFIVR